MTDDVLCDPLVAALVDGVERVLPDDGFVRFRDDLTEPFAAALRSDVVAERIARLLDKLAVDPQALPPYSINRQVGAMIFSGVSMLGVTIVSGAARSATFTSSPRHRLIGCLGGRLIVKRYALEANCDPAVLDRSCGLTPLADVVLAPGEHFCLEAWCDVSELSGSGVVFTLQSPLVYATRWAYSRATLKPVAIVAAERGLGRLEDALQMLSILGGPTHAKACEALLNHQSHAVRWEAVRVAFALGHPDSRRLIDDATRDQHPHVRKAASAAMAMLAEVSR
jgi:hypothetical protein